MKRFSIVERGYDIDEVNKFIDIVINRLEKLNTENATYVAKIEKLNLKLQENSNKDSQKIEKALLAMQDIGDRLKDTAKEEAKIILEEAKNNASSIVHEALINAEKTEQERLLLEKNMKIYKERIKSLIETQLELAKDLDNVKL